MEVQLQAALVTASAVVVGLVVQGLLAVRTLRQRRRSDDRDARWSRIQWAVDHTLTGTAAAQEVGAAALYRLIEEPGLEPSDADVIEAALSELDAKQDDAFDVLRAARDADGHDDAEGDGHQDEGDPPWTP